MLSRRGRNWFHRAHSCVFRPLCTFIASVFRPTCFCSVAVKRGHRRRFSMDPSTLILGLLNTKIEERKIKLTCHHYTRGKKNTHSPIHTHTHTHGFHSPSTSKISPVSHHTSTELLLFCSIVKPFLQRQTKHKFNFIAMDHTHPLRPGQVRGSMVKEVEVHSN